MGQARLHLIQCARYTLRYLQKERQKGTDTQANKYDFNVWQSPCAQSLLASTFTIGTRRLIRKKTRSGSTMSASSIRQESKLWSSPFDISNSVHRINQVLYVRVLCAQSLIASPFGLAIMNIVLSAV